MVTAILPQISLSPTSSSSLPSSGKSSNAKIAALLGICTGLGALITLTLFLLLPRLFVTHGWVPMAAVQTAFYVMGAVACVFSLLVFLGLKCNPNKFSKALPKTTSREKGNFQIMKEGVLAAKDPRIALVYVADLLLGLIVSLSRSFYRRV